MRPGWRAPSAAEGPSARYRAVPPGRAGWALVPRPVTLLRRRAAGPSEPTIPLPKRRPRGPTANRPSRISSRSYFESRGIQRIEHSPVAVGGLGAPAENRERQREAHPVRQATLERRGHRGRSEPARTGQRPAQPSQAHAASQQFCEQLLPHGPGARPRLAGSLRARATPASTCRRMASSRPTHTSTSPPSSFPGVILISFGSWRSSLVPTSGRRWEWPNLADI
jgi:hypothetical protein